MGALVARDQKGHVVSKGAGIGGHATGPEGLAGNNPTAEATEAAILAMGLANAELVSDYTGNSSSGMNSYLLRGKGVKGDLSYTRHVAKRVRLLQKTLLEAPQTRTAVTRGMHLPEATLAGLQPGTTFRARNFFSTSEGNQVAEEFGGRNTVIHIANARGVNVRNFAGPLGSIEKEILLPAGRRFKIEAHAVFEGTHILHMRQLN